MLSTFKEKKDDLDLQEVTQSFANKSEDHLSVFGHSIILRDLWRILGILFGKKLVPNTSTASLPCALVIPIETIRKRKFNWWFQGVLLGCIDKKWVNGFLFSIKKIWNSLLHYFCDLLYAIQSLIHLTIILLLFILILFNSEHN